MAKIAFLSFYSGVVDRGAETFVYELSKRLTPKHKITIFQAGQTIHNPRVRTYQIKAFANFPKSSRGLLAKLYLDWQSIEILIFAIRALPKILPQKFDVIILMNGGWQTIIYRIFSKVSGSKIIITGHAGIGADDAFNIFFRPDAFVALTKVQYNWAKKITSEVNITLIPNGVDLAAFNPKVKAKNIPLKKPIIVCAAALVPYKQVDLTIKAVAKTSLSLLLLGNGQMAGQLDTLGKRLLGNKYLRTNPAYREMPSYYTNGKVFTLASKTEAFGIAYLEAMACNLPIVATNDESRAEIIGDAGILTDPKDISRNSRDLQIAAKTNYRNIPYDQALKFSWNRVAGHYTKLIKQLTT